MRHVQTRKGAGHANRFPSDLIGRGLGSSPNPGCGIDVAREHIGSGERPGGAVKINARRQLRLPVPARFPNHHMAAIAAEAGIAGIYDTGRKRRGNGRIHRIAAALIDKSARATAIAEDFRGCRLDIIVGADSRSGACVIRASSGGDAGKGHNHRAQ